MSCEECSKNAQRADDYQKRFEAAQETMTQMSVDLNILRQQEHNVLMSRVQTEGMKQAQDLVMVTHFASKDEEIKKLNERIAELMTQRKDLRQLLEELEHCKAV